jgi:hypothetical protein
MELTRSFSPPKRNGSVFHAILIIVFVLITVWGLWQAARARVGPVFFFRLVPTLLVAGTVPILVYRAFALQSAGYILERDGIRLRWGFRMEDIPMDKIQWLGLDSQLDYDLPKPFLRWPGAVLGVQQLPDHRPIEYLAARSNRLVVIITPARVFAISPEDEHLFLDAFRQISELGSLSPIPAQSTYPVLLFFTSWADRPARLILTAGGLMDLILLAWVFWVISIHSQISFRLATDGSPLEFVPAVRLLLLPVLNTFFYLVDALLGLIFYRRVETRPLAFILWGSSIFTSLLFMGAVIFISMATE